jgi:hypothetical protein
MGFLGRSSHYRFVHQVIFWSLNFLQLLNDSLSLNALFFFVNLLIPLKLKQKVGEHLPTKHKALNSSFNISKKPYIFCCLWFPSRSLQLWALYFTLTLYYLTNNDQGLTVDLELSIVLETWRWIVSSICYEIIQF